MDIVCMRDKFRRLPPRLRRAHLKALIRHEHEHSRRAIELGCFLREGFPSSRSPASREEGPDCAGKGG